MASLESRVGYFYLRHRRKALMFPNCPNASKNGTTQVTFTYTRISAPHAKPLQLPAIPGNPLGTPIINSHF